MCSSDLSSACGGRSTSRNRINNRSNERNLNNFFQRKRFQTVASAHAFAQHNREFGDCNSQCSRRGGFAFCTPRLRTNCCPRSTERYEPRVACPLLNTPPRETEFFASAQSRAHRVRERKQGMKSRAHLHATMVAGIFLSLSISSAHAFKIGRAHV